MTRHCADLKEDVTSDVRVVFVQASGEPDSAITDPLYNGDQGYDSGTPPGTPPGPDASSNLEVSFGYGPSTQGEAAVPFGLPELTWGSIETGPAVNTTSELVRGYTVHLVRARCFVLASLLCALLEEGIDCSIVFWEEQNECDKQQDCINQTRMSLAQQGVEGVQEAL